MPFAATWMDTEMIILSEERQKKKKNIIKIAHTFYLKYETDDLIYKRETDSQT